jgi:hypothetical protein
LGLFSGFLSIGAHQNNTSCFYALVIEERGRFGMSLSNGKAESKAGRYWFSSLAMAVVDSIGASRAETLEIVTDVEQVSLLFAGLDDARQGRIISMSEAFGDL